MVIVVIPSHAAEEASGPPIVRISQRLIDGLEHLLIEPPNPRAFLIIACLTLSFATSRRRCDRSRSLSIRSLAALTACGPTTGKPCVVMVGGAGRDGRQSHPRHACFRNRLAGGGTGSSSSGALCSRRTNARTCHHRSDRSRIPLALGVLALGPPRHLTPGVASNTIHAHGELVRLLVATFRRRLWPLEPWRASVHTVAMCHGRCRCGLALALQGGR